MKVKVSGRELAKLQRQSEELFQEILADKINVAAKEKELEILREAIASLEKLGGETKA